MPKVYKSNILAITTKSANKMMDRAEAMGKRYDGFVDIMDLQIETEDNKENSQGVVLPIDHTDAWFAPRGHLETDENFKQIIPYVIVERHGKVLLYERTNTGGEFRLHNKVSVGFGGHVDIGDVSYSEDGERINIQETVANAAIREIREELEIEENIEAFDFYGVVMKDDDPVDKVHIGFVLILSIRGTALSKESQIEVIGFTKIDNVLKYYGDALEGWSKSVLENLQRFGFPK